MCLFSFLGGSDACDCHWGLRAWQATTKRKKEKKVMVMTIMVQGFSKLAIRVCMDFVAYM